MFDDVLERVEAARAAAERSIETTLARRWPVEMILTAARGAMIDAGVPVNRDFDVLGFVTGGRMHDDDYRPK